MKEFVMTPEVITTVASALISLLFAYIPGFRVKFASLEAETKRSIMLGAVVLVVLGAFGGQYLNLWNAGFTMDRYGLVQIIWSFFLAAAANQGMFGLAPKTDDVKLATMDARMAESNNLMIGG